MASVKAAVIYPHSQDVDVFEKVYRQEHGIDAAIAEKLSGDGAAMAVNFSNSAREADTVVANVQMRRGRALAVRGDVSKPADAKSYLRQRFGHMDAFTSWLTTLAATHPPRLRRLISSSSTGILA